MLCRPDSRWSSTTPHGRCSGIVGQEPTGRVRGVVVKAVPRGAGAERSEAKRLDRGEHTRTLPRPTMPPMDTIRGLSHRCLPTDSAEDPELLPQWKTTGVR